MVNWSSSGGQRNNHREIFTSEKNYFGVGYKLNSNDKSFILIKQVMVYSFPGIRSRLFQKRQRQLSIALLLQYQGKSC